MKVGYSVEGSTDRAFIKGLKERWCPYITLEEGHFRGSTGQSQRREIDKICFELNSKDAGLIIFLRDANNEDWKVVLKEFSRLCPNEFKHLTIFGVCDRNIECWICADVQWIANKTNKSASEFQTDDPKGVFEDAMEITGFDKKEKEISKLVLDVPIETLKNWYKNNPSFNKFYEDLWQFRVTYNCQIENIR